VRPTAEGSHIEAITVGLGCKGGPIVVIRPISQAHRSVLMDQLIIIGIKVGIPILFVSACAFSVCCICGCWRCRSSSWCGMASGTPTGGQATIQTDAEREAERKAKIDDRKKRIRDRQRARYEMVATSEQDAPSLA
jgi:hypothetical protein